MPRENSVKPVQLVEDSKLWSYFVPSCWHYIILNLYVISLYRYDTLLKQYHIGLVAITSCHFL